MSLLGGRDDRGRRWRIRDWVRASIVLLALAAGIAALMWGLLWAVSAVSVRR